MGRLFWKFFCAILAAQLTSGLGVGLVVTLLRPERPPAPILDSGPRAVFVVSTAAAILRQGGIGALRPLIEDWAHGPEPLQVLVVDTTGSDALGRKVMPAALSQARAVVARPLTPGDPGHDGGTPVRMVQSPDGAYLLFMEHGHRSGGPREVPLPPPSFSRADGDNGPAHERRLEGSPPYPPNGPPHRPMVWPVPVFLAGLLASIVFSALLAWYFAKPVRLLRWAFGAVAEGRLETRVQPLMGRRRDEIADLGREFDQMAHKLQQLVESQRRLLHDVSHEIRSPLARLQLAIDLARQDPRKMEATLDRVEGETSRLHRLVGELLTLVRLETGTSSGQKVRADLAELVAGVVEDAAFEATANNRQITFAADGEVMVCGEVALLLRAIENVVRNAVKYTAANTTVAVRVETDGRNARIIVCDHGPGVPEADLVTIFEPFFRSSNVPDATGFGLGLAIATRAIKAHDGTIQARNRPEGGLRAEMCLPLASP